MTRAVWVVLRMRDLVLQNSWLESLLVTFDLPLRQMPPQQSWAFGPYVRTVLTTLQRYKAGVATALRLEHAPAFHEFADMLLSREVEVSIDMLLTFLAPIADAMRIIANPVDIRAVVCAVIDVLNFLLHLLQGDRAPVIPRCLWPTFYDASGEPLRVDRVRAVVPLLVELETRLDGPYGEHLREAAQLLIGPWLLLWSGLLQSDLARLLLLPSCVVGQVLSSLDGTFFQVVRSLSIDSTALLDQLNALEECHHTLTFRALWEGGVLRPGDPAFALVVPALVCCRYVFLCGNLFLSSFSCLVFA